MYNIYPSSRILRSGQHFSGAAVRICMPSVSRNTCVYMQSPSSSYHTKTRVRCKLLLPSPSFSQFSTMPAQRSNSYFTSILQKVFVVKAAEPFHDSDIPAASPSTVGSTAEPVFESASTGTVLETASTGTVLETASTGTVFETSSTESVSGITSIESGFETASTESVLNTASGIAEPVFEESNTKFIETDSIAEESNTKFIETDSIAAEPVLETGSASVTRSVTESTVESTVSSGFDSYIPPSPEISYIPPPPEISYIPPPPAPPEAISHPLNALGEPTLQSLGLGSWTPSGLLQNCMDFLHVTFDLPWWGAIGAVTVCIRLMVFPLVIMSQKNSARMHNNAPQLEVLQSKMTEARNSGNQMEAARLGHEMMLFMKEKQIKPLQNVLPPLVQAPIFISMFVGLRKMANLPMESMKDGGMFWFTDLTIADPFYILPVVTTVTMMATIELGTEGLKASAVASQNLKWILRGVPLLVFPFSINFPAAILCYWVSSNIFSLGQVSFLRIPVVREYFKIPKMNQHRPETLPPKKGMVEGFKSSWSNMKITRELEERERYDEIRFKQAGLGPIVRTHKHDPTKKIINVKAKVRK